MTQEEFDNMKHEIWTQAYCASIAAGHSADTHQPVADKAVQAIGFRFVETTPATPECKHEWISSFDQIDLLYHTTCKKCGVLREDLQS